MKRALFLLITPLVMLALIAGYVIGQHHTASNAPTSTTHASSPGQKVLYWYDTMVPDQHFDHPGLSPMGMQMVPKYANDDAGPHRVRIDAATVQNLGIRTQPVQRRILTTSIDVPGSITWDLRQASVISARVDGIVNRLYVRAPYTSLTAGQPVANLLAPQWASALAEYSALQHAQSTDAKALLAAARQRLRVLGLNDADAQPAPGGITLRASQAGVVTSLDVREGQRVTAGQTLMTLNGLSTVWVEAALPQAVAGLVHAGTPVTVTVTALPGHSLVGTVETLLPDIDATTRTQRARIVLDNPNGVLSPGMFVTVQLTPPGGTAVPVIPDSALINTGDQTRVIVAEGGGRFQVVPVHTGRSSEGYTEVTSGIEGPENIVVSGQFLIDSEANLSGALDRLDAHDSTPAPASTASMPGMSMGDPQ